MKGADHVFEYVNPACLRMMGHRDVIGKPARKAFPEVMPQGYFEILDSVWATGEPIRIDAAKMSLQLVPGGALEDRFFDLWYEPVRNAAGMITGVFTAGVDVTEHIAAQSALQGSEEFLRSVLGASSDCIKVLDLEGRLVYLSSGGRTAMEVPDGVAIEGTPWPDFWQGPDQGETTKALELARSGSAATFQGYANTALGNRRYWDVHVTPMLDANAQPERILVVSRDITYMKRIEEERELLMNEVAHRLKNAFGMVQSVINQTLRKAESVQEGHQILSGRIRALASAQDILTRSTTSEMLIGEVVEAALLPHRTGEGRFDIAGPEAAINGRQSLGLSLALHELATNATKYGALSGETGRVAIGWDIKDNGSFSFHWVESCGPPVTPPGRSGFGSVLIEKIVATYFDGSATLDFLPGGIAFHLRGVITPPDVGEVSDPY